MSRVLDESAGGTGTTSAEPVGDVTPLGDLTPVPGWEGDVRCQCYWDHDDSGITPECDQPPLWKVQATFECEQGHQHDAVLFLCHKCLGTWRENDETFTVIGPL